MVLFPQRTFTSLVHAHAGRTPAVNRTLRIKPRKAGYLERYAFEVRPA
jgi:hypothetical protein